MDKNHEIIATVIRYLNIFWAFSDLYMRLLLIFSYLSIYHISSKNVTFSENPNNTQLSINIGQIICTDFFL